VSGSIPYTTGARPDTGFTNPKLGLWLFLASEVMLFGSFFSSYALLRYSAPVWPDQSAVLNVPLASVNTVVLVVSSLTMMMAMTAARRADAPRARRWMGLTLLLGMVFLGIKSVEYVDKMSHGLVPATNNFLGLYYTMTGLHALHVLGGIAVLAWLAGPGMAMARSQPERFTGRVEVTGIYWQFVDVVWLILFPVLYLS
jgi:heme/copper-type cytochrome/quinol oxidase subunit 3